MSIEFLITSLIIIVSPGTGVLYTLAAGLSRGARASVVAAFGCTLGIVPHMIAAIMGLAALLHASALAFHTFKYLGVAYLLYMAWNALKEQGALRVEREVGRRSAIQVTVQAILINILNPKLSIFFFAFLPQFVDAQGSHPTLQLLLLGVTVNMVCLFINLLLVAFSARLTFALRRNASISKWLHRGMGALFIGLGLRLAVEKI